ncbi:MAG: MBL fold metallo-hydrolase [Candidatus Aminicenantes bacterium]
MRIQKFVWVFLILFIRVPAVFAQTAPEIPIKVQRLSGRVLFIKTGESPVMSNVTAVATTDGIVMIDAHYKPEMGTKIRSVVEKVFNRTDFAYLIYSHAGVDHIGGSPAFTDAVFIGHQNCIDHIDSLHKTIEDINIKEGMAPRLKIIQDQIDAGPDDPSQMTKLEEAMLYWSEMADLLASGFRYTKPSITFNDRLNLQVGDVTLELCYCTPGYSQSDILIHVPQEKLLVVGDIFVEHRVPLFDEKTDLNRWKAVFSSFIDKEIEIQHIIGCHGELMTIDDIRMQLDYLSDLWEAVYAAKQKEWTLEQVKQKLSFSERYAHLSHLGTRWVSTSFDLHERNIEQIWKTLNNSPQSK